MSQTCDIIKDKIISPLFNYNNIMAINIDTIGQMAGLVWNAAAEADTLSTKQIKKVTKLKDKELYAALGWLAREGKISFQTSPEDEKELLIQLVK